MKEMIRRAVRTFIQTAAGYTVVNIAYLITYQNIDNYDYLIKSVIGIAMSAISAGLAAIMNLPKSEKEEE